MNLNKIKIKGLFVNMSRTNNNKAKNCTLDNVITFNDETIRNIG